MKVSMALVALTLAFGLAARAEVNNAQFEVKSIQVREIADVATPYAAGQIGIGGMDCSGTNQDTNGRASTLADDTNPLDPINTINMIVDQIINIGKKIFNIVEMGKPTVDIKTDIATAMPKGARCWADLETWQVPQSKVYQVSMHNGFNEEVVKLSYRLVWLPGGSVAGVGQYIGYATISPVDVQVAWGFNLNAKVSIPTVFNMGTKAAPVAGMNMNMEYHIENVVTNVTQAQAYFVDGKGGFQQLQ